MQPDTMRFLIATLCYSDIFHWPLTREELLLWFVGERRNKLPGRLPAPFRAKEASGQVFVFLGSAKYILRRRLRERWALAKWKIAVRAASILRFIPTLLLVGVTGGLARNSAEKKDDIDLFIVSRRGTLWVSRLLAVAAIELLGVRRRPGTGNVMDTVCLNMFMAEDFLSLPKEERDLFSAYEVLQMRPLWEREGTYQKFLFANRWAEKFLPNAWGATYTPPTGGHITPKIVPGLWRAAAGLFEPMARGVQLWYMQKRHTTEVIAPGILRFHPHDARVWIKDRLQSRLRRFHIPLDKIFYGG